MLIQTQTARRKNGFTIVELLIVIVIIAILAVVTTIAFNGVRNRAIDSGVKSNLATAAKQLELDRAANNRYPASLSEANGGQGLLSSQTSTALQYTVAADGSTYCLSGVNGDSAFNISSGSSQVAAGVCSGHTAPGDAGPAPNVTMVQTGNSNCCSTQPNTYINISSKPAQGDLLFLFIGYGGGASEGISFQGGSYITGWQSLGRRSLLSGNNVSYEVFYKIAGANEPTSGVYYKFTSNMPQTRVNLFAEFKAEAPYQFSHAGTSLNTSGATSVTSLDTGSATATQPFNLIIGSSLLYTGNYTTPTATWTNGLANSAYSSPYAMNGGIAWKVDNIAGAKSNTVTWPTSAPTAASTSVFSLQK